MTCVKGACDVDLFRTTAMTGARAHTQLPSHQPVPLLFNQQRHHPIRLDLTSYIPSKLSNAVLVTHIPQEAPEQ